MDKTLTTLGEVVELPLNDSDEAIAINSPDWFNEVFAIQAETDSQYKELYNVCQPDYQVTERSGGTFFNLSWFKKASRTV
jgi:hypothetical protein